MRGLVVMALVGVLGASVPAPGAAQGFLGVELERVRQLKSSDVLDPFTATLGVSDSGRTTVLWGTAGASFALKCVVIVIGGESAALFEYTFEAKPTQCDAVVVHDGGFLIRGSDPSLGGAGGQAGFTASIDAQGQVIWEVPDRTLTAALPPTQGGSGEFIGRYLGPASTLVYHAPTGVVMGTSQGEIEIVGQKRVVYQAHLIEQRGAKLRVSGRTFGVGGTGKLLGALAFGEKTRFLVAYATSLGDGVQFVTYDGRQSLDAWRVAGTPPQWKGRTLNGLYDLGGQIALLWSDGVGQWATLAGPNGELAWEGKLMEEVAGRGGTLPLGFVSTLVADDAHLYAWHTNAANEAHLSVYDRADGSPKGVVALAPLRAQVGAALGLVRGEGGGVRLVTTNRLERQLTEYALTLGSSIAPPTEEMGQGGAGDMGGSDGPSKPWPRQRRAADVGRVRGGLGVSAGWYG